MDLLLGNQQIEYYPATDAFALIFSEMVYEKAVPIGDSLVSLDILDTAGNVSS